MKGSSSGMPLAVSAFTTERSTVGGERAARKSEVRVRGMDAGWEEGGGEGEGSIRVIKDHSIDVRAWWKERRWGGHRVLRGMCAACMVSSTIICK